jgi:hypothetical protein
MAISMASPPVGVGMQHKGRRGAVPEKTMDVEAQIEALNTALRLQHRSALQYTLTAGASRWV